jgi:hypothetical protein
MFQFDFRLREATCVFCSVPSFLVHTVFSVSGTHFQLHLVPRPFFSMHLLRAVGQLVVIVQFQPTPIYQTFFPFSIHGLQLRSSSFCNIDNLIWPKPMCPELPWMLHELSVIYQYQISLLECFILDMSVLIGLFSVLLYLLMISRKKSVFL